MTIYEIKVTTLSPLHIGDGQELRLGFDFMITQDGKHTCRLNQEAILEEKGIQKNQDRSYKLPGQMIDATDFGNPKFFRYIIQGAPQSKLANAVLRSCIKDAFDRPYIPGSTIKGALRSALGHAHAKEKEPDLLGSALRATRDKFADDEIEKKIFGADPNTDFMRAMQVSDCIGLEKAGQGMLVLNAQVLTLGKSSSPVELEAIGNNVSFSGTLKVDDFLFSQSTESKLHFGARKGWVTESALLQAINQKTEGRLQKQVEWYSQKSEFAKITNFISKLSDALQQRQPNQAIFQMAWGTGWDGMTYGDLLQVDEVKFERILSQFRMVKNNSKREQGDQFPKSHRAILVNGIPRFPLGWVLLELNPRGN